jgi:hypothetical protein
MARRGSFGKVGSASSVRATSTDQVRNARIPQSSFFTVERVTWPSRVASHLAIAWAFMSSRVGPKRSGHFSAYCVSVACVVSS